MNGKHLRAQSLSQRKRQLDRTMPAYTGNLFRILSVDGDGHALFDAVQRTDLEGIVAKRKADPYGPATVWYKVKNHKDEGIQPRAWPPAHCTIPYTLAATRLPATLDDLRTATYLKITTPSFRAQPG